MSQDKCKRHSRLSDSVGVRKTGLGSPQFDREIKEELPNWLGASPEDQLEALLHDRTEDCDPRDFPIFYGQMH